MSTEAPQAERTAPEKSFAETALALGGKSADEARRTGAIDTADDQVESLFAAEYQTVNSPAHRAVWDRGVPANLFASVPPKTPPEVQRVMDDAIAVAYEQPLEQPHVGLEVVNHQDCRGRRRRTTYGAASLSVGPDRIHANQ